MFLVSILRQSKREARLRNDAATAATGTTPVGVNGSRGVRLGLGEVGGEGEERSKEIH